MFMAESPPRQIVGDSHNEFKSAPATILQKTLCCHTASKKSQLSEPDTSEVTP